MFIVACNPITQSAFFPLHGWAREKWQSIGGIGIDSHSNRLFVLVSHWRTDELSVYHTSGAVQESNSQWIGPVLLNREGRRPEATIWGFAAYRVSSALVARAHTHPSATAYIRSTHTAAGERGRLYYYYFYSYIYFIKIYYYM